MQVRTRCLSYYNGQSYTFTWEDGNRLASAVTGGKTVTFEYNSDGIRTEKHVSGTADYYYSLSGSKVIGMASGALRGAISLIYHYAFLYVKQNKMFFLMRKESITIRL